MTKPTASPEDRYRRYLQSFGISGHPESVLAMRELDLAHVRFFAFEDDQGIRLKAAVTEAGLVRSGRHAEDDWRGLLAASAGAGLLAERIAWLETDEARGPGIVTPSRTVVVRPGRSLTTPTDPSLRAMAAEPTLSATPDGTLILQMWLLEDEADLVRWIVTAPPRGNARIDRQAAAALFVARPEETLARATELLAKGDEPDRLWALQAISDASDPRAAPAVAALLMDPAASDATRSLAAGTLARLDIDAAATLLGTTLREAETTAIRRACAQALGQLRGPGAVAELSRAAGVEPDAGVRFEIVHALNAHGEDAREALRSVARTDVAPAVRNLAKIYIEGV